MNLDIRDLLLDLDAVWAGFFWAAGALPIVAIAIMVVRWMLASHSFDEYDRGFRAGQELERVRSLQAEYMAKIDNVNSVLSDRLAQPLREPLRTGGEHLAGTKTSYP